MASKARDYIIYYKKKLQKNTDEDIILNSIHKLAKIPMTYELLQETGIGKAIRNYSKESGKVGDKAKIVYQKWKNVVAESVQTSTTKHSSVKSDNNKKVHSSKDKTKTHYKAPLSEIDSLCNDNSKKSSTNFTSDAIDNSDFDEKYAMKDAGEGPLYTYEKTDSACEYIDYDPNCNINLGYSPDHPELYPERNTNYVKESVHKSKHTVHNQKTISHSSPEEYRSESTSVKSNGHISKSKKLKTDDMHLTVESKSHKSSSDSKTVKANKDERKHKHEKKSPQQVEFKKSKHESKEKSKSDKNKVSDSKPKTSPQSKDSSPNAYNSSNKHQKTEKGKPKSKLKLKVKEAFTSSEVSFEDCLGFNDIIPVKKKKSSSKSLKKKEKKIDPVPETNHQVTEEKKKSLVAEKSPVQNSNMFPDIASTLPQIQPNYRPLMHKSSDVSPVKRKVLTNEDAIRFTSSKKEKTAVYSGRRNYTMTEVPTLFSACIQVLIDNIDAIECLGGTPYFLVKPVMERCTPAQLLNIENYNPLFLDETQELWQMHCKRDFRTHKPDENETYRDMYLRILDEREKRLKNITAHISASMSKSAPSVRKAKLAYVDSVAKPPRDVARKQAKHGTALPINHPVKVGPPSKATPRPTAPAVNAAASTSGVVAIKKPKVAPLMAKTLKSLKQCFRR